MMAGVDMVHVPYRGGASVPTALLGGQVQVLFGSTSLTIEHETRWGGFASSAAAFRERLDLTKRSRWLVGDSGLNFQRLRVSTAQTARNASANGF